MKGITHLETKHFSLNKVFAQAEMVLVCPGVSVEKLCKVDRLMSQRV